MLLKLLGEATDRRAGHRPDRPRGPLPGARRRPASSPTGYGPGDEAFARLGIVGPDPDGLPRHHGRRAGRRALRLADPRRGLSPPTDRPPADQPQKEPRESGPLRAARCRPRRGRRRHQEGLPATRPAAAPRRQPRPGGPGEVQGGLAAPTRCCPTRRSGRRTTAAATRSAAPAVASARAPASRSPTSWTRSSAAAAAPAGQGRGPRPRERRGQDALIRLEIELAEAAFGVTRELKVDTAVLCTHLPRRGRGAGHPPDPVRDLPRRGRGRARAALVPRRDPHPAPVRGLPRLRHDHPGPLPRVLRRRPGPLAPHA